MTLQVQIKTPTMWRTVSRVWKIQSSGAPRPQRGSPADRDVQLLTRDVLLAMLNLTCVCVCMCRGIRMIYWRLIIHVSTVFPCSRNRKWRSPHLEDMWHQPTQGLVPLETSVTSSTAGFWPLEVISWRDISSFRVVFHGAQRRKCHSQFTQKKWFFYSTWSRFLLSNPNPFKESYM